jgi:beta-ureidopropionase
MSKEAADEVARAKQRGNVLFAETLAAALGTDGARLWHRDWDVASRYVMSPPLGPDKTVKKYLMKMLQAGVLEVVGTDNCTFCTEQKRMGKDNFSKIPNGVNGLEDRLSVVWTRGVTTGLLSPSQFVEAVATKAAKIFNLYPRKGEIAVGSDADLVVWDHKAKRTISCKTHHQKVDYNVFEGQTVFGKASYTFSRGRLVFDGQKVLSNPGSGQFVKR